MSGTRTRTYRHGTVVAEDYPLAEVSDHLATDENVVWVDLVGPSSTELQELASELDLHELAVEDAFDPDQRPKLDRYETHLFVTSYHVQVDVEAGHLDAIEVDAFVNPRWLITVHREEFPIETVVARWDRSPDLAVHGVGFLLHGLLDVVVDGYFDALAAFDDYYEDVSDALFADQPVETSHQRHWFDMRRAMVRFHRLVSPMRETVSSLMRREQRLVPEALYPYYQDVYDHILRVGESSDVLRDLVTAIVETNITLRDYRQNLIVKKVSSWAAIVAVPALITGYYGMNVVFPGFATGWGAVAASALIVAVPVALYRVFRRRDWL